MFAIHTGMRCGEILHLTWAGVDLNRRTATVFKSKNGERRTIPLSQTLVQALQNKASSRRMDSSPTVFQAPAAAALRCPQCLGDAPLDVTGSGWRCARCTTDYPRLGGLPWLLPAPQVRIVEWRQRYRLLERELESGQQSIGERLRDPLDTTIPPSKDVANRLGWKLKKFNKKLDEVCRRFHAAGFTNVYDPGGLATSRRNALVDAAIQRSVVTPVDLVLLDLPAILEPDDDA